MRKRRSFPCVSLYCPTHQGSLGINAAITAQKIHLRSYSHQIGSLLCIREELLFLRSHRKRLPLSLGSAHLSQKQTFLVGITSQIPHLSTDLN